MAELKRYRVDQGNGMETEMQLTEADAERLGATEVGPAHDVQPADENEQQPTPDADATGDNTDAGAKTATSRTVQNRARRTQ